MPQPVFFSFGYINPSSHSSSPFCTCLLWFLFSSFVGKLRHQSFRQGLPLPNLAPSEGPLELVLQPQLLQSFTTPLPLEPRLGLVLFCEFCGSSGVLWFFVGSWFELCLSSLFCRVGCEDSSDPECPEEEDPQLCEQGKSCS